MSTSYNFSGTLSDYFDVWFDDDPPSTAQQTNGVLRFHSQGQLIDDADVSEGYLSKAALPRYDQSWSAEITATVPQGLSAHSYGPDEDAYVEAGLVVFIPQANDAMLQFWAGLGLQHPASGLQRVYNAEYAYSTEDDWIEYLEDQGMQGTADISGLMGIRFDATTKVLTAYSSHGDLMSIDIDAAGITDWNMADSDTFQIGIGFTAENWTVPVNLAPTLDDFSFSSLGGPIVGNWYSTEVGSGGTAVLTFGADGTYMHAEVGEDDPPWGQDGMESGTYTWNAATGAFDVITLVDTNGEWGLSEPVGSVTVQIMGNTLSYMDAEGVTTLTRFGEGIDPIGGNGNDTLNGSAGNDYLFGNDGNDMLFGDDGNDVLWGGKGSDKLTGGLGADTMEGGLGNDTYGVDNTGDVVIEQAGEGIDTVQSNVTYSLSANVEKLQLTGTNANNGTGNGMNNVLSGNSAKNKLWGNNGADKLVGNNGNDSLYGGSGNDTLQGGGHSDLLVGGAGKDVLTGGTGPDYFVFNTALNASTNVDTLTDFTTGVDKIRLDDDVFKALGPVGANTVLTAGKFYKAAGATSAHDADDRIIYNTSTGALYYDADGKDGSAAIKFAILGTSTHPSLVASDLVVIA